MGQKKIDLVSDRVVWCSSNSKKASHHLHCKNLFTVHLLNCWHYISYTTNVSIRGLWLLYVCIIHLRAKQFQSISSWSYVLLFNINGLIVLARFLSINMHQYPVVFSSCVYVHFFNRKCRLCGRNPGILFPKLLSGGSALAVLMRARFPLKFSCPMTLCNTTSLSADIAPLLTKATWKCWKVIISPQKWYYFN